MAVLGLLFFASVLIIALWSIVATIQPRVAYIADLLSGSTTAPVLIPVAQRRRVRQLNPLAVRSELQLIRAIA